ncbi:DUF2634 domain-containing protein [Paenibacillus sp. YN15]|uniref:DUF2634 domain-containing protein n=1 Tax=Paenibacillus sp. YN15 TaxID=1742774 RepID=UPI00215CF6B8|nr:DUF2634 domain-containing protein [Paenibacillus sp. YN15]
MAGIFPFMEAQAGTLGKKELPLFREYAWDYGSGQMKLVNGAPVVVEGQEALQVWIYKALHTARYRYLGYSPYYGSELEKLVGSAYTPGATQLELARYVREALTVNPYITGVPRVEASFRGNRLEGSVTVDTIYGEVKVDV